VTSRHPNLGRAVAVALAITSTLVTLLIGRIALAGHIAFEPPNQNFAQLRELNAPADKSWHAIHVFTAGCQCSRKVADHLIARGSLPGLHDSVVLVGTDPEIAARVRTAGLKLTTISSAEASDVYHVEGAPMFILIAPDRTVRYAGGYSLDRGASQGYQDVAIWRATLSGLNYRSLPIFGCAAGHRARKLIDPFGLNTVSLGVRND
jgi:hypothetical protein